MIIPHLRRILVSLLLLIFTLIPYTAPIENGSNFGDMLPSPINETNTYTIEKQISTGQRCALDMLDSLFAEIKELQLDSTRLKLQVHVADMLWQYDEPRARQEFENALVTVDSVKTKYASPIDREGLRQYILKGIERHDSRWAKELALNYLHKIKRQHESDEWVLFVLVDIDPQYATTLMKHKINKDENIWLYAFISSLQDKEPRRAEELFAHVLSVAERDTTGAFDPFHELFPYVFPQTPNMDDDGCPGPDDPTSTFVKPDLVIRFLNLGYKTLMREASLAEKESGEKRIGEAAALGYLKVKILLPIFDHYLPDMAAKILARWDKMVLSLEGGEEHIKQVKILYDGDTIPGLLRQAEKAIDPDEAQVLYLVAWQQAIKMNDFTQALSISAKIREEKPPFQFVQKTHICAAKSAIIQGDLDAAYYHAKKIGEVFKSTELMNQIVELLQQRKETEQAARVFNDALERAKEAEDHWDKLSSMHSLASTAIQFNETLGFEVMKQVIEISNRIKNYELGVDDFDKDLLLLARIDFNQALSQAQTLKDKESQLIAKMAVCRGVLIQDSNKAPRRAETAFHSSALNLQLCRVPRAA